VSDLRVRLSLGENGHRYEVTDAKLSDEADTERPLYIGPDGTKIAGDAKILTYLAERPAQARGPGADMLQGGTELQQIEELLEDWRDFQEDGKGEFESLGAWETALSGRQYLGGTVFNIDDCSLWPVLREIVQRNGTISKRFPNLRQYYQRVENRGVVKVTLEESG
jgi:glutathione S-transferase